MHRQHSPGFLVAYLLPTAAQTVCASHILSSPIHLLPFLTHQSLGIDSEQRNSVSSEVLLFPNIHCQLHQDETLCWSVIDSSSSPLHHILLFRTSTRVWHPILLSPASFIQSHTTMVYTINPWLDFRLENTFAYPYDVTENMQPELSDVYERELPWLLESLSHFGNLIKTREVAHVQYAH